MFEIFQDLNTSAGQEHFRQVCREEPKIVRFLSLYVYDKDDIMTPAKIFKAMHYLGVENGKPNMGEIGEYAATRAQKLKTGDRSLRVVANLESWDFVIKTYRELKYNISAKAQNQELKTAFLLLSVEDVKWFARFLTKKIQIVPIFYEVIKNGQRV